MWNWGRRVRVIGKDGVELIAGGKWSGIMLGVLRLEVRFRWYWAWDSDIILLKVF